MRDHLWAGDAEFEVLEDAWLEAAEAELGVKLPAALVDALRVQNGGPLRFDSHAASRPTSWATDHIPVPELRGIGPEPEEGLRDNPSLLREWALPQGLLLLCGEGHTWVALDYRESDPPSVIWVDTEESVEMKLADSFETFLAALVRADTNHSYGFPGVGDEDLLVKTLSDACQVSFTPNERGHVAEHSEWKSEFGEPAYLMLGRNVSAPGDPPSQPRFPERLDCEWVLSADIMDDHREALAEIMARLPFPTVTLHLPHWDREQVADPSELGNEDWDEDGDDLVSDLLTDDDDDDDDIN